MVIPKLKDRSFGYEFAGFEYKLIFKSDNIGFVRYKTQKKGEFYLDPAPYMPTLKNEYYVIKQGSLPEEGTLIEATVLETEQIPVLQKNIVVYKNEIKYVTGCRLVDPREIMYEWLTKRDDFFNYITIPIQEKYNTLQLQHSIGLYMASSPSITDFTKGGINTVLFGGSFGYEERKYAAFKRMSSIIPREFFSSTSKYYYSLLSDDSRPNPINSTEVSLCYNNRKNVPVHLPIPLNIEYKPYNSIKEEFVHTLPLARAYMLDAHLFNPKMPDRLVTRMEEAIYFILDDFISSDTIPYAQDLGNVIPLLANGISRLDFQNIVTSDSLNKVKDLWLDMMNEVRRNVKFGGDCPKPHSLTLDEDQIIMDLKELKSIGIPTTRENLKKKTKVIEWKVEDILVRLSQECYIYFKPDKTIEVLEY